MAPKGPKEMVKEPGVSHPELYLMKHPSIGLVLIAGLLTGSAASADPKFDHQDATVVKDVKDVEWEASAQGGMLLTSGNSEALTLSAGAQAKRREGDNQFQFAGEMAYGESSIFVIVDEDDSKTVTPNEVYEVNRVTTNQWLLTGRYDRFLPTKDSLYLSARLGADDPAGKDLLATVQGGYSYPVHVSKRHDVTLELGYDFSYEDMNVGDGVSIHSARAFFGWKGKATETTSIEAATEFLVNLNETDTPTGKAEPAKDTRVNGSLALTSKLWGDLSFRFGFSFRYDTNPAPRPAFDVPYADGYLPVAEELDTKTEASLIYKFL